MHAVNVCPKLVAISESTKRDLMEIYAVEEDRIDVVYPGGGETFEFREPRESDWATLNTIGINRPFVLQVGRIEARKNQATTLAAVRGISDVLLVVAGPVGETPIANTLRESPQVRLLGYVPDTLRGILYRCASALVYPSLYEGFGLPLVEAMSAGLPIVTARNSSLEEVAGQAATYVDDPYDVESLTVALRRVIEDPEAAANLRSAGLARSKLFTWEKSARMFSSVVGSLV
jgi:glycosyltransferase involved in cell wall biosynthesis